MVYRLVSRHASCCTHISSVKLKMLRLQTLTNNYLLFVFEKVPHIRDTWFRFMFLAVVMMLSHNWRYNAHFPILTDICVLSILVSPTSDIQIEAHDGRVNDLAFAAPNKQQFLITCGNDGTVKVCLNFFWNMHRRHSSSFHDMNNWHCIKRWLCRFGM